jgi:heme exporter protein B
MMKKIFLIINRDLKLNFSNFNKLFNPLIFLTIIAIIFPFAIGSEQLILKTIGPGVILSGILLASSLASINIISDDYKNGCLDAIKLSGVPYYYIVLAKIISHWIVFIIPSIVMIIPIGIFYNLTIKEILSLQISVFTSSFALSAVMCLASFIVKNHNRSNFISALISMPLNISILIFTASFAKELIQQQQIPSFFTIIGITLIILPISCFFSSITLKK